ncbi:GyrI-like domain-containing protein [uncultured Kordia sp.]|uniref:AraC family transcriptional regulator n=1 Tax=uncultured Kordia sp. TaxID=507699 RepID=UPI002620C341|nr:AraC family transcriptional regulator [uncultured Kordia sp.]
MEIRQEYTKRINDVLDFIENNLEANLSLDLLASKAHYSSYHFHRVFSTIVGENLNQYINRKRIERIASILLVHTDRGIKELAYKYGFNSDSSFSRAFKKYYGISPTQFKTEGKEILSKIGIEVFSTEKYICSIDNLKKWIEMNAQITLKKLEKIQLASIMNIGNFDQIPNMYQRLMEWGHAKEVVPAQDFKALTIYHDNPNVTELSKVRYSACITVNKELKTDGDIRPVTIQKGNYAVGNFVIDASDFPKAWKSMSVWVIENNYTFRDGTYFEVYLNDYKTHPQQKHILEIYIPIEEYDKTKTKQIPVTYEYHELIGFMKKIKSFFAKEYNAEFKFGNIYQGNKDYSYFSLTTEELKKLQLKFVIILDHTNMCFKLCLSGQNKDIRKKYWTLFKESNWNTYTIVTAIEESLSIIDHTLVKHPNFEDITGLIAQIETESFKFINEIRAILES